MTSFSSFGQPSMLALAQEGNFRAIAYLINRYLAPNGIYVRTAPLQGGCLQVRVELPSLPENQELLGQMREGLTRFICHHIWQLNSEVIDGVRIIGLWTGAGSPNVLWRKSIRIVTPANQQRKIRLGVMVAQAADLLRNYKTLRVLLLSGSAIIAFILGFSVFYAAELNKQYSRAKPVPRTAKAPAIATPERPKTVQTALETVSVIQHKDVVNPADPTVTMMFGGDVTLGYAYEDLIGTDRVWAFDAMPEYREADLAMVNLEGTFTNADTAEPDKEFHFQADPEAVETLTYGGVDIVTLANNHAMDYQEEGLKDTMSTLKKAGIHYIGAGMDETEARKPQIIDVKGQRIAYFGYFTGEDFTATATSPGVNNGVEERIAADIKAVRGQVDWIIVNFHWGAELANYPEAWQINLAHHTIDAGADVIIGHHPHVLQGTELYKGRPIAYSLGNFIFGGNARSDYDTAVLKVSVRSKQMKVEVLPVEVTKYQPKIATEDRGKLILENIDLLSGIFNTPMKASTIIDAKTAEEITDPAKSVFAEAQVANAAVANKVAVNPETAREPAASATFDATPFTTPTPALDSPTATTMAVKPPQEKGLAIEPDFTAGTITAAVAAIGAVVVTRQRKTAKLPEFS